MPWTTNAFENIEYNNNMVENVVTVTEYKTYIKACVFTEMFMGSKGAGQIKCT